MYLVLSLLLLLSLNLKTVLRTTTAFLSEGPRESEVRKAEPAPILASGLPVT